MLRWLIRSLKSVVLTVRGSVDIGEERLSENKVRIGWGEILENMMQAAGREILKMLLQIVLRAHPNDTRDRDVSK